MSKDDDDSKVVIRLPGNSSGQFAGDSKSLPEGKLEEVTTYLEMHRPPRTTHRSQRSDLLAIIRARKPTISFYRYLYQTVGEPWMWYERNLLSDDELEQIVSHSAIKIYVLYVDGVPAGFAELDCHDKTNIELAYFGLIPEFIGRGLGQFFLDWAVDKAWSYEPKRLFVHSCNFDHPKAIATYQKAGFKPYEQQRRIIDDPRLSS